MATLLEIYNKRNDSGLRNRVQAACLLQAKEIVLEDAGTPNHAERLAWAKVIVQGGPGAQSAAQTMVEAMVGAGPDTDYSGDPAVTAAVGNLVGRMALLGQGA